MPNLVANANTLECFSHLDVLPCRRIWRPRSGGGPCDRGGGIPMAPSLLMRVYWVLTGCSICVTRAWLPGCQLVMSFKMLGCQLVMSFKTPGCQLARNGFDGGATSFPQFSQRFSQGFRRLFFGSFQHGFGEVVAGVTAEAVAGVVAGLRPRSAGLMWGAAGEVAASLVAGFCTCAASRAQNALTRAPPLSHALAWLIGAL